MSHLPIVMVLLGLLLQWGFPTAVAQQPAAPQTVPPAGVGEPSPPAVPASGWEVRFGLGFPSVTVESDSLNRRLEGGKVAESGVVMNLDLLLESIRIGYVRQLYRKTLSEDVRFEGASAETLSFDSDQVWIFHGLRALDALYLGYGLGWQRRTVRVRSGGMILVEKSESGFMGGLVAEWAFSLPFSLNLRIFSDLNGGFIEQRGAALQFNYQAEF